MPCHGAVQREDQEEAASLDRARAVLSTSGADALDRRPWQHEGQPASDTDLVRFAAWRAGAAGGTGTEILAAGLKLLVPARAELDQLEAGLLFAARAAGMTWPQLADALDLGSPQAAQQRLSRLLARRSGGDPDELS